MSFSTEVGKQQVISSKYVGGKHRGNEDLLCKVHMYEEPPNKLYLPKC